MFLFVKISSGSLYSRHYLIGNLIWQKWHAKSNMLGWVTLQFIRESLETTCKLRTKIPGKALGTKIPPQLLVGCAFAFLCSHWRSLVAHSPCGVPRSTLARHGTAKGWPFCRECLLTVPRTCNKYQETETGEHQVKPLRTQRACMSKLVQRVKGSGT